MVIDVDLGQIYRVGHEERWPSYFTIIFLISDRFYSPFIFGILFVKLSTESSKQGGTPDSDYSGFEDLFEFFRI